MIRRFLGNRLDFKFTLLPIAVLCAACAPQHSIRPYPDFVHAAIEPGDTVIVTTTSGETTEFVVPK